MQHRRALGDHGDAEPSRATAADDAVDFARHALGLGKRVLRRELVGFVDDQVEWPAVQPVECGREGGHEAMPASVGEFRQVDDRRDAAFAQQLR